MNKFIKLTGLYVRLKPYDFETIGINRLKCEHKAECEEEDRKIAAFENNANNYDIKTFPIILNISEISSVYPRLKLPRTLSNPKCVYLGTTIKLKPRIDFKNDIYSNEIVVNEDVEEIFTLIQAAE